MRRCVVALCVLLFCLTIANSTAIAREVLRFGVITLNHPLVMYRHYLPFTDYIAQQLGIEIELVLAADYQGIVDAMAEERVDIALLAGVSYLKVQETTATRLICAVRSQEGTPTSRSAIVVRADREDIRSLDELKGHSFAFGSKDSTSSYLGPLGYLVKHGITPDDFSHWQNFKTHDAVIRALLRGKVDAGAVSKEALAKFPAESLKVLAITPQLPGFVLVSTANVPEDLHARLQTLLLNLNYQDPELASSLERWSPMLRAGFTRVDESHYAPVQTLMQELEAQGFYGEKR